MIKVGSDFSGVGAFNQALLRLGIPYEEVFACDMDKYARQTFVHNYGEPNYYPENVYDREIPTESLDIYMTSPPCQSFSLAGRRKGEDDRRGILFYNSHEFIKENRPRYFIFENVKGLLSDAGGLTFKRWCEYLGGKSINSNPVIFPHEESVPYHIYWKVLNAKNYNIPQNRERVFIIGIRDDEDNNFTWPKELFLEKRLKDVLEADVDEKYYLSDKMIDCLVNYKSDKFQINTPLVNNTELARSLNARMAKMGRQDNYIEVKSATSKGYEIAQIGEDSINFEQPNSHENPQTESNLQSGELRNESGGIRILREALSTIQEIWQSFSYENEERPSSFRIRKLTPREAFRLMDFPDSFTWPVSDSQAYKQAGNSICVGVLAKLIGKLNLGVNQAGKAI